MANTRSSSKRTVKKARKAPVARSTATFDIEFYLDHINDIDVDIKKTEKEKRVLKAYVITKKQNEKQIDLTKYFSIDSALIVDFNLKMKWHNVCTHVENPHYIVGMEQPKIVPKAFVVCSGRKRIKKYLVNVLLNDWSVRLKKKDFFNCKGAILRTICTESNDKIFFLLL